MPTDEAGPVAPSARVVLTAARGERRPIQLPCRLAAGRQVPHPHRDIWHCGRVQPSAGAVVPAIRHMRTEAERRDQRLSWARSDEAFFAAGACHVLAFRLRARRRDPRGRIVLIHPAEDLAGSHAYVTDGTWAFDFNAWTLESTLLEETVAECRRRWPTWDHERVVVEEDLDSFCARWGHRPPEGFAFDVVDRADRFLDRLLAAP